MKTDRDKQHINHMKIKADYRSCMCKLFPRSTPKVESYTVIRDGYHSKRLCDGTLRGKCIPSPSSLSSRRTFVVRYRLTPYTRGEIIGTLEQRANIDI